MDIFAPESRTPIPAGFVGRLLHHLGDPPGATEALQSAAEETELSEWDAASMALVGRPFLAAALERGELPHTVTPHGGTWIVRLSDLLAWMRASDAKRQAASDELTRLDRELPDDGYAQLATAETDEDRAYRQAMRGRRRDRTILPDDAYGALVADLDAPPVPNERTREAARRLGDVIELRPDESNAEDGPR